MNKKQAKQKFHDAVYGASGLLEELSKSGRLKVDGREVRKEFAESAAEFIEDHWVSFDEKTEDDFGEVGEEGEGDDDPDPDATMPSMDSAVIAQEERKRSNAVS